jgi:hypothetical protein
MPPISVNPTEKTNRILCNYFKVLKSLADWITQPAVHEVGCEAFWGLGFGIKLYPNPASEKGKMGERKRKNESWHLEKKTKGCWQKEKEERILGLLSQFRVLRKSYS